MAGHRWSIKLGPPGTGQYPERCRAVRWTIACVAFAIGGFLLLLATDPAPDASVRLWLLIAYGTTTLALAGWASLLWILAVIDAPYVPRDRATPNPLTCAQCGYSFKGIEDQPKCPECGWEAPFAALAERQRIQATRNRE